MKTYVINLPKRQDRLNDFKIINDEYISYEVFEAVDGYDLEYSDLLADKFDVNHNWIDPILNTRLTKGEVGCFLSHWKLWKVCIELDEPILILEDDAIITDKFSYDELYRMRREGYDFIYLGWKEMGKSIPINDKFVKPVYPYWTLAYMVTPESARRLLNPSAKRNIIPVDEYLPTCIDEMRVCAYKENVIVPKDRKDGGSDVLAKSRYDFFVDFETKVCTVATDPQRAVKLFKSAGRHKAEIHNLGKNVKWEGGTMEGQGGGHKINLLKEFLYHQNDNDVILFLDGYDTFLTDSTDEIISRYMEFNKDIVFASERFCWPDEGLASDLKALNTNQNTPYQYLNSGMYIGRVGALKKLFAKTIKNYEDDQLYIQKAVLTGECDIALDVEGYIFVCHEPQVIRQKRQLFNPITQCYGCAYHGNGGESAKEKCDNLYHQFYGEPIISYSTSCDFDILSDDMLLIDFMSEDMCKKMISLSEKHTFRSLSYDKVKGQELRLKEIEKRLYEEIEEHWNDNVYPIVWKHWKPCHMWGMRDAFIIKYAMDMQRDLPLHNDASLVTGSVKLNDDYLGGQLVFPRQDFANKEIPVGKCILFPGQVTHGHSSVPILSGVKYSLTIWSQRYEGDVI